MLLPWSKSITNRDLILAALSWGETRIRGMLFSDDTHHMIAALKKIWFKIHETPDELVVSWGIEKLRGCSDPIFLGNSGTSMRFLTALWSLNNTGSITFTGNERMQKRPLWDLILALEQLGCEISHNEGFPPVTITAPAIWQFVTLSGSTSSQFLSALLMIWFSLPHGLEIHMSSELVSKPYIEITMREMQKFGIQVTHENYQNFSILPGISKSPGILTVEGDASALSYWLLFVFLHGWNIGVENLWSATVQWDFSLLYILEQFGIETSIWPNSINFSSLWVWKLIFEHWRDFSCSMEKMPDVALTFFIIALFLPWMTRVKGLQTLNLKECRRIEAMGTELWKLWVDVEWTENSITIGEFDRLKFRPHIPIEIETYDDHRIAMCFGILNSYIGNLCILNPSCVNKTYPNFWQDLDRQISLK